MIKILTLCSNFESTNSLANFIIDVYIFLKYLQKDTNISSIILIDFNTNHAMMCSRNCVAVDSVYSLGTHLEKGKNSLLIGGKGSRGRQKSTPTLRSFPLLKTGSNESDMMDVGIFPK